MALAAGQTGHLTDHQEGVYQVDHGATAGTARPTLGSSSTSPNVVLWNGSVEPTNASNGDWWFDSANSLVKVKEGGSFVASGSGTYGRASATTGKAAALDLLGVPGASISGVGTENIGGAVVEYAPIVVDEEMTLDQFAIEVTTTGAGSLSRAALYTATSRWQPDELVVAVGTEFDLSTTGVKTKSVSATVEPGRHLIAYRTNGTATHRVAYGGANLAGLVNPSLGSSMFARYLYVPEGYGAFASSGTDWTSAAYHAQVGVRYPVTVRFT